MNDTVAITCPYCFERVEVYVDPETHGELVQDCDVCCRPWALQISRDTDGNPLVRAARAS
jgi:hypothetical protein